MRCPKCRYISFESGDRCRNCGYEFSLSTPADPLDLPIHDRNEPIGPMADLQLAPSVPPASEAARGRSSRRDADDGGSGSGRRGLMARLDLPLFGEPDAPLVTPGAAPRAPLAVRRGPPAAPRPRPQPDDPPTLDLGTRVGRDRSATPRTPAGTIPPEPAREENGMAGRTTRLAAGLIDAVLLVAIDVAVLFLTLRLCDLSSAELRALPAIPLASFLLLLTGGYFVCFTAASGQTIGKMMTGLRVVTDRGDGRSAGRVSLDQSIIRAMTYLLALVPAGLGLVPALVSEDRRALHDRLAHTRVVKA